MVSIANHGGSCCGARHLLNFDTIVNGTVRGSAQEQILTALSAAPVGRRVEVILNERQVTSARGREILDTLANLGFVLAEQYMNHNHNPPRKNFVFTRCDTRKRTDERLPFTWSGQWLTPNLHGNLPAVPAPTPAAERVDVSNITFGGPVNPNLPMVYEDGTPALWEATRGETEVVVRPPAGQRAGGVGNRIGVDGRAYFYTNNGGYGGSLTGRIRIANYTPVLALAVGCTVQVTRPQSDHFNRSGVVEAINGERIEVRIDGVRRGFGRNSLRVITGVNTPTAPPVIEPQRHTQGEPPIVADRPVAVAPPPPVRVVYTTWHNVLQRGTGAGWETLEDCRAAAPRCRQQLRRDIMSDGAIVDTRL